MSNFSRRRFLITTATCAVAVTLPAAAAAASVCTPNPNPPTPNSASGQLGTVAASVKMTRRMDSTRIRYGLTNVSGAPDSYTVSFTDQITMLSSRAIVIDLQPGQSMSGVMYGSLNHTVVFYVDLSDGTVLSLGPVGELPACELSERKRPRPIYQPPNRHAAMQKSNALVRPQAGLYDSGIADGQAIVPAGSGSVLTGLGALPLGG